MTRLVSAEQMLRRGLRVGKIFAGNLQRKAVIDLFRASFGLHPRLCSVVWKDLLVNGIVGEGEEDLFAFFAALSFLRTYDKEKKRRSVFEMNEKTLREVTWPWVRKIAALKALKITWPAEEEWETIFICSVGGTHRRTQEPRDPHIRRNPRNYSHKFSQAGVNHEIALHLYENRVVHAKRFDPAGRPDKSIFKDELVHKVPHGKRVVVDNGYDGLPDIYSAYNQFDSPAVRKFKKRAKSRQESFNRLLKHWEAFDARFRSCNLEREDWVFDAVVTLCQYEISSTDPECAMPLFDI